MMNLADFTPKTYADFLVFLKGRMYHFGTFSQIDMMKEPYIILRHDVDGSLEMALEMAKIEDIVGVNSTYFVMASSHWYNIFEPKNREILFKLIRLGNEVGLHYSVTDSDSLFTEIDALNSVIRPNMVTAIAPHNPSTSGPFITRKGYLNAYHVIEDRDMTYISDSCRAWRPDIRKLLYQKPTRVQLLIHPMLWAKPVHFKIKYDRNDAIYNLFLRRALEDKELRKEWVMRWDEAPHVKDYDTWKKSELMI